MGKSLKLNLMKYNPQQCISDNAFLSSATMLILNVRLRKNYIKGLKMNCKAMIFNSSFLMKMSYCTDSR